MVNQTAMPTKRDSKQAEAKRKEERNNSRCRDKEIKRKKNYHGRKKRGQQGPLETKRELRKKKGGITIMDQPINLPSQFISFALPRCRDPNIPSRGPEIMRNVQSFIPPVFPYLRRLSRIIPPMILSIDPCRINDQIIKSESQ
ncbi:hypothetical protein V8C35DRAFT_195412 [Trichoderma chlorosporum]